jgi:hypothetical protein
MAYSVIVVPHDVVMGAISEDNTPDRSVADKVKLALRAEIALAGGHRLGYTSTLDGISTLSEEKAPKLWLHSTGVQALEDPNRDHETSIPQHVSPATPYENYDWTDHGLLPLRWATDAPN